MTNNPLQRVAIEVRDAAKGDRLDCVEVRFAKPAEDGTLEGYAVRFDVVDSYRTTFDRRAFVMEGRSLPLLWAHDQSQVLGSVRSITPGGDGLKITARLNLEVQRAREVRAMLMNGDISGLSIGFQRLADEARSGGIRHITKARLHEVSVVAVPSVPGSRVTSVRATPDLSTLISSIRSAAASFRKA